VKTLNEFKKVVGEIEGFEEPLKVINKWKPEKMLSSFVIPAKPMKCGFRVLNHGDDWLNNMMFKVDDDGNSVAVKLVDFQFTFWGSPIGDLYYFLFTSVRDDVKIDQFDEFIEHYHSKLREFLEELGFDGHIPTLSELQVELLEMRQFGELL
jgi:agmatine/peptidylarginine deiminase